MFKKDDDTRDANDTQPEIKKDGCCVCHSDMHKSNKDWYCVLCGYEEDENGNALL